MPGFYPKVKRSPFCHVPEGDGSMCPSSEGRGRKLRPFRNDSGGAQSVPLCVAQWRIHSGIPSCPKTSARSASSKTICSAIRRAPSAARSSPAPRGTRWRWRTSCGARRQKRRVLVVCADAADAVRLTHEVRWLVGSEADVRLLPRLGDAPHDMLSPQEDLVSGASDPLAAHAPQSGLRHAGHVRRHRRAAARPVSWVGANTFL